MNNNLLLKIDTYLIENDISGIQLYLKDIELIDKTSDDSTVSNSYYTNYASELDNGWIVASNYIESANLSIMYFEKDNDKKIQQNTRIISLNSFGYTSKSSQPRIVKESGAFVSRVVDVVDNQVICVEF